MPPTSEYTNRLRVERKRRGWNQTELADLAGGGITQPDVSLYERGLVPPADTLERLGAAFGVPGSTILAWLRESAEEVA